MTIVRSAVSLLRRDLARPVPTPDPADVARLRARLDADGRRRPMRALRFLHVATGCCGACAASVDELRLGRLGDGAFGFRFVEHPAEADVLLVTGLAVRNAARSLGRTAEAMGRSAIVVAVGDCAAGAAPFPAAAPYAATPGGAASIVAVDLAIRGAPPAPDAILLGLLTLRDAAAP